jgi:hypothetical protein
MSTPQPIPTQKGGFLSALFDISFSRLVTTRVIRWLYLLLLVLIGLGLLGFLISAILSGSAAGIVIALVVGPIVALLYVVYARVLLEVILAIFRILESNREIAFLQRQQLTLAQQQAGVAPEAQVAPGGVPPVPPYQPPQPPAA